MQLQHQPGSLASAADLGKLRMNTNKLIIIESSKI